MYRKAQLLMALFALTSAALAAPVAARAQSEPVWEYTGELFGSIGSGHLYEGDSSVADGLAFGGGAGFRPFHGWAERLGVEVQAMHIDEGAINNNPVSRRATATVITGNLLYHFRSGKRVQPYVFGGVGHVSTDRTSRCTDCVYDFDQITGRYTSRGTVEWRDNASNIGISYGTGVKWALQQHLSIRPELLLTGTTAGSGANFGWLQIQIGAGVHF